MLATGETGDMGTGGGETGVAAIGGYFEGGAERGTGAAFGIAGAKPGFGAKPGLGLDISWRSDST